MSFMKYKGYRAKIEYEAEDQIFHGVVVNILDTISFMGSSVDELTGAFRESIDSYVAFCKDRGEEPEKPYSGKFQLRMPPHLHALISLAAKTQGVSLNTFITEHMQEALGFEYEHEPNDQQWQTVSKPEHFQMTIPCAKAQQPSQGSYKTTRTERRSDGPVALAA